MPIDPRDRTPQGLPVGWSDARPNTFTLKGIFKGLGCIWLLMTLFLGVVALAHREEADVSGRVVKSPTPATTFSPAVEVDIRTLHKGQCYDNAIDPDQGSVTSCYGPHDGEILGTVRMPANATPSDVQLAGLCRSLLSAELARLVDQEVLALTWSLPIADRNALTCSIERGIHVPPLNGSLTQG